MIQAIEMQAKDREFIESAAPMLVSSDGADIDGLERDLLASGRYVGQEELGLLIQDWAETFGGRVSSATKTCCAFAATRRWPTMCRPSSAPVSGSHQRSQELRPTSAPSRTSSLSLDQELSRISGIPLLTATHPLTRAAAGTPGTGTGDSPSST